MVFVQIHSCWTLLFMSLFLSLHWKSPILEGSLVSQKPNEGGQVLHRVTNELKEPKIEQRREKNTFEMSPAFNMSSPSFSLSVCISLSLCLNELRGYWHVYCSICFSKAECACTWVKVREKETEGGAREMYVSCLLKFFARCVCILN